MNNAPPYITRIEPLDIEFSTLQQAVIDLKNLKRVMDQENSHSEPFLMPTTPIDDVYSNYGNKS